LKKLYSNLLPASYCNQRKTNQPGGSLFRNHVSKILLLYFLQAIFLPKLGWSQNSLNSGDFSTGSWGVGQAMSASAGGSLIITKGVSSSGDKYFRFYGDGSPCGEYQPNANGDFFTHDVVVTNPNANCGGANAWRINVPTASSNVVFKTDGGNDGIDRSIAFVVQGNVESVSSSSRAPAGNVYPGQDVVVTANLTADFSTGQAAWLRYTNDAFATSTVVKMTGSGTTRTATIPGATNTPSTAVAYYIFTSSDGASISGADADFYTINLDNNGGSNYSYTTQAGWTTAATGNWNAVGKWVGGGTPPIGVNMGLVTIAHATTLNQDALVGSVFVNNGLAFTLSAGQTLEVASGGSISRTTTGTISANATSTVRFLGNGTIGWANTWGNLETGGALNVSATAQTITTKFQLNSGGSITLNPTYTATSSLVYNTGGSYNVGNEWTSNSLAAAPLAGRPVSVVIQNTTDVTMPTSTRAILGGLNITSGSLSMSGTSGADLILTTSWTNAGTFNPNGRAVFFSGATASTISNSAGETFSYLILNKTAGNTTLNNSITINGNSGDVLQLLGAATTTAINALNLGGNNVTLSGTSGNIFLGTHTVANTPRCIIGTGNIYITGPKTVTRTLNCTLQVATTATVVLSNGLDCGAGLTNILGTLQIDAGGFVSTNAPVYGAASTLIYNSGGPYGVGNEWTASADGNAGLGLPNNVTIQNSTTVNLPINFKAMAGTLTIGSGSTFNLNASGGDFSLRGNWVNNGGTFNHNNRFVAIRGAANTTIGKLSGGPEIFRELIIQKSLTAFNTTLTSDVTISGGSTFALQLVTVGVASTLDLGGFNLRIQSSGDINIGTATASTIRTITGTGNLILEGSNKLVTRNALANGLLTITGSVVVRAETGINFGSALTTLNSTFQLNTGGSVVTNPPLYGLSSTLIYNQGGSVNVASEWTSSVVTAVVTAGRPANVTIDNNTDLTLPNVARSMFRNFTVTTGSFTMDAGANALSVGANWTRAAGTTFTSNGRPVTFWAITATFLPTNINVVGGETFDAVTLGKTAGVYVNLGCDVVINGALTITTGRLNIGSNTLTLNNNVSSVVTNGTISGTSNSNLIVNGSGASANLIFTTAVAENQLGSLVINRSGPGTVTLGSNLILDNNSGLNNTTLTLTQGWLQVNAGFTLTVANTAITGSTTGFVFTQTTGRLAYSVTGAGTYNLDFPIGSAANVNSYRRLVLNNVVQTNDNTYSAASTAGSASSQNSNFNAPLLGGSTVRYYPVDFGNLGVLTSIGTVSLSVGADDNPIGIDNQTIIQVYGGAWNDIGALGGSFKTSTSAPDITASANLFAFGFTTLGTVFVNQATGSDAFTGQTSNNVPAGTGPKQTFAAAMAAVTNGGTLSYTGGSTIFAAQTWDIDKNINFFFF